MDKRFGRRIALFWGLLGCYSTLIAAPYPAQAYVRSRTGSCQPLAWQQSCVYVQADSDYAKGLSPTDIEAAIKSAIGAWQTQTRPASFLQLNYLPASRPRETSPNDGLQVIKFRSEKWCRPKNVAAPEVCYDTSALAITIVTYVTKPGSASDGQIKDADIELNAVQNRFTKLDPEQPGSSSSSADPRPPVDLWNTLTHELGHLQGLDHVCSSASDVDTKCTVDDHGLPRPLCLDVAHLRFGNPIYEKLASATMSGMTEVLETRKRVPQADDVQGVLDGYPANHDPGLCASPGAAVGCTTMANREAPCGSLVLTAVGLLLSLFAWRSFRRRQTAA